MKKTAIFAALLLGLLVALGGAPAATAQEDLDTILARAAAKSYLNTLVRPELAGVQKFYVTDGLRADNLHAELGDVTGYTVTRADWLVPGQTFEVQAALQPGERALTVHTGKYNNRWKVDGVELTTPAAEAGQPSTTIVETGLRPVSGNGSGLLAFQTRSGGDIYVINADGTGLRRVTHGIDPQLSPDGTQIAFTRWNPQFELFTINTDGSNERSWFSNRKQMKSPAWSADGSKLVFSFQNGGRLEPEFHRYSKETLIKRAAKGSPVNIPDNARGIEFKDGKLQFVIPADAYWWLAEINLTNQTYRDLSTGSRYNYAPSGHPIDPNAFIFRTDKGMGLYDDAAQTSRSVSFDDRDRGAISISPDGSRAAFTYFQDGNWEIHTINMDGTNRQRLTKTPLSVVAGRTAANNRAFTNAEGFTTMSRAQGESMPNVRWNNAAPVWSPDGSQIAFVTDRTGRWEIWIMNADGSNQRPMFPNGALDNIELNFDGVDERMLSWR
ncbi:MAG: hypothetical protein D6768_00775 [Chloroflexi bacterium]|nr:MAG: hypothetical protein D6768_00775 [Chloroflexota bacterium]